MSINIKIDDSDHGGSSNGNRNKELLQRIVDEVFYTRNYNNLEQYIHSEFVDHSAPAGATQGVKGLAERFSWFNDTFRFERSVRTPCIAEGDYVAQAYINHSIHTGTFKGVKATKAPIALSGVLIVRFKDGKVIELWDGNDLPSTFSQQAGADLVLKTK